MLRITKATDPISVERLVVVIYSPPGQGKTTLAFTADKPLLLDFDGGVYRSAVRQDSVPINSWADVGGISADDLKQYKTLIIDTAGRALDALSTDIIEKNPKMGRSGGALTLQGYGELKSRFISFTKLVRSFGLDIVLLAHSDEQRGNGDDLIERIDVQGGSKNEIYKAADVMGRLAIKNGKRVLNFSPSDTSFGKNPAGLPELVVPSVSDNPRFLGEVIEDIKGKLNKLTAEQQEVATTLAQWQIKFDSATTPDALNGLMDEVRTLPEGVKENVGRLWLKIGKGRGWKQNGDTKLFESNGFNPLPANGKDKITKKQITDIDELVDDLELKDKNGAVSTLFGITLTVDQLSKEAGDRFIADLTAQIESREKGAMF